MDDKPDTTPPLPQRKHLSHPSPVERHNEPVIVFVTLTIQPRGSFLDNLAFSDAFVQAYADAGAWSVGYYLIMPDHVHLFCSPAQAPRVGLLQWVSFLKRRVTIRLAEAGAGRSGVSRTRLAGTLAPQSAVGAAVSSGGRASSRAVAEDKSWRWQSDCWDTQIRSGGHYHEKWEYVRQNPVRAELVEKAEVWPWQGVLSDLRW